MLEQYNELYNWLHIEYRLYNAMNVIWRGASVGNALSRLKQLNTQEKNTPPEKLYDVYAHPEKTSSMQKASTH